MSSKEYLEYILEQLPKGVKYIKMMGEFILIYENKIFGGIYDNRLLVKNTSRAFKYLGNPVLVEPYESAKKMLLVEEIDDKEYLNELVNLLVQDLPERKVKKKI